MKCLLIIALVAAALGGCTGRRDGNDGVDGYGAALGVREVMSQSDG